MNITLATLHQYSAQEVFDYVCNHLLTQNEKSVDYIDPTNEDSISCKYRNEDGLKCAAGCLIGDEEYLYEMEGFIWSDMVVEFNVTSEYKSLIRELQKIHDTYPTSEWEDCLERLAEQEGLEFN